MDQQSSHSSNQCGDHTHHHEHASHQCADPSHHHAHSSPMCDAQHRTPAPLLDISQIRERLERLTDWQIDKTFLVKSYHFENPVDAMAFITRIGAAAEKLNHHPHLHWWKRDVQIELWTHKSNGLTSNDFDFAACVDKLYEAQP